MSLGGGTGYDGRDLEDRTVDYATKIGITVSTSNGNDGPASITTGSPGTAHTSVGVGAAAHPVNTRIFWDVAQYGVVGIGDLLFTSDVPQIYAFSSRGPTSDGRQKPTLSATGIFVLSAITGSPTALAWASGTSMSCPAVSGAIALLNSWGEAHGASPYDYKQALIKGAVPLPGYDEYDQGAGYLDAYESFQALQDDCHLGSRHPRISRWSRHAPVRPKGMEIPKKGTFTYHIDGLAPGHAEHFYFKTTKRTEHIQITFTNVELGVDLGLNSFEVYVQSATRSGYDYYFETANVWGDATFDIYPYETTASGYVFGWGYIQEKQIQPGWTKIVIENDWTSYDSLSADVEITIEQRKRWWSWPDFFEWGIFRNDDDPMEIYTFEADPEGLIFELWWNRDWPRYPTSDLDMIIWWWDSADNLYLTTSTASLSSPESVKLDEAVYAEVWIMPYSLYGRCTLWWLKVYQM
jgi:hypothetical protein